MITLLVDLNGVEGNYVTAYLEPAVFLQGSPAQPPELGEWVRIRAEGGIACLAVVSKVDGPVVTMKMDASTWEELPDVEYDRGPHILIGGFRVLHRTESRGATGQPSPPPVLSAAGG